MMGKGTVWSGKLRTGAKIRSVLAPNPSMMTQNGTNTYIVGSGQVAVIDPGPAIAGHQDAILSSLLPGEVISHIFVTHTHLDHSGLALGLAQATGAPVYAFGSAGAGRSAVMARLASQIGMGGGEGTDYAFAPDVHLADGDCVSAETWRIEALHTPGHLGNHLCFGCDDVLLTGDHVMGWSTSLISPPDGDMTQYIAALHKLADRDWHLYLPGHGPAITQPAKRIADLLAHRLDRERALLAALDNGPAKICDLVSTVYTDLAALLIPAAERNILAHLVDLIERNLVRTIAELSPDALFELT